MSRETLEFHHDKHHLAYVNNGNNALKGTEWEGKPLEEIVKGSFGKNPAVFNNAGQHYNHIHFWKWMKPNGGGKIPGEAREGAHRRLWLGRQGQGRSRPGWRHPVRLRLGLAHLEGRQGAGDQDRRTAKTRSSMAASRSSASTSGSTPTTSTIATGGPTISRRWSIISSIGNMSPSCSARSKRKRCAPGSFPEGGGNAASIRQIERPVGANIDACGVQGLPVCEGAVQIDLAVLAARNARRRLLPAFSGPAIFFHVGKPLSVACNSTSSGRAGVRRP